MKQLALALVAIVLGGHLLLKPFREGWSRMNTDFPNAYTAAVATLHHQPLQYFYDWTKTLHSKQGMGRISDIVSKILFEFHIWQMGGESVRFKARKQPLLS